MTLARRLTERLGVRPHEVRTVSLSFGGAFLVMSFVVLARSLREAAYLAAFDATTLPYVTGGVVALGFALAALYSRALGLADPRRVMRVLALLLAAAVAGIWPFLTTSPIAVVAFYLVTAAGAVLLASGFWLIVSEALVVREAKRLFGLISAGGTLGLLVTGTLVGAAVQVIQPVQLVPVLALILLAYAALNELVPDRGRPAETVADSPGWTNSIQRIFARRHLSTLTMIVLLAAMIGGLIDYQFKEAAQDAFVREPELAAFFGMFYGWTGGLALAIQLLLTTRVMSRAGIAWSLAVLPLAILVLSAGMLLLPGLILATGLRGTDSALRKSLFRSVVEFLWVPVDTDTRRRTKTFVDTIADNAGEGLGAIVVLLVVTLGGFSSLYLSLVVIAGGLVFLALARTMGREYFATLQARLAAGESGSLLEDVIAEPTTGLATLSRIDLTHLLATVALEPGEAIRDRHRPRSAGAREPRQGFMISTDDESILARLTSAEPRAPESAAELARLLARDRLRDAAARRLIAIGEPAAGPLATIVQDPGADFVVRRRVAGVLGAIPGKAALDGLVGGLTADRFEVRYRAARSMARRRENRDDCVQQATWTAIRSELSRGRAVWELARLLDPADPDELVGERTFQRGELSLEHVFRLLSLVLDADAIHAAWAGMMGGHSELESLALEYLEQVLPDDVREGLWPFIGDLSAEQARRAIRPLDDVIHDLMDTGATLFGGDHKEALARYLRKRGESDPVD